MGANIKEAPTPNPPSILKIRNNEKFGARADPIAEIVKIMAQAFNIIRLPNRSLNGPDTNIAKAAITVNELTENPSSISVRLKSICMNLLTPEMTEASNPIKKPPSATISAIRKV